MILLFVSLILGLSTAQTPPQPPVEEVLRYAPADADFYAYLNLDAIIQPSLDWIEDLLQQPFMQTSVELKKAIENGMMEMEAALNAPKEQFGVDMTHDIHYVEMWFQQQSAQDDDDFYLLVAVKGDYPDTFAAKLAPLLELNETKVVSGTTIFFTSDAKPYGMGMMQMDDGFILLGSVPWLEERAGARSDVKRTEQIERLERKLGQNPISVLDFDPGHPLRKLVRKNSTSKTLLELIDGTTFLTITSFVEGLDIDLDVKSQAMAERFDEFLSGVVELCRASQTVSRGAAKALLGFLSPDDPEIEPILRPLLTEADALLGFVLAHTGDGSFVVTHSSKNGQLRYTLRAGHLREILTPVVPIVLLFIL